MNHMKLLIVYEERMIYVGQNGVCNHLFCDNTCIEGRVILKRKCVEKNLCHYVYWGKQKFIDTK